MKTFLMCGTAALGILTGTQAAAQAQTAAAIEATSQNKVPSADEASGGSSRGADEIIVTAQRRAENVQKVPISITAFNATMLRNSNVVNLYDLPRVTPSLRVDTGINAARARVLIRGVGTQGGTAIEPSVATFLDGVYIPREGQTVGAYLDLAGLEVLRGPQGTLFGRNASAGAINLRSALPEEDFSGRLALEAGSGERYRAEGHVNVPVGDGAALRFAGKGELNRGLFYNRLDDQNYGGTNNYATRLTGQFDLSPNITWTVRGNLAGRHGNEFSTFALLPDTLPAGSLPGFLARFASIGSNNIDLTPFDHEFNQYIGDHVDDTQWGLNSTLEWDVGSDFTVKLIDGYQDWKNKTLFTGPYGAEVSTLTVLEDWTSKSHSHELQLISPTDQLLGGRFSFVAGLYYFHERWTSTQAYQYSNAFCRLVLINASPALFNSCVASADTNNFDRFFGQSTDSYAAYGQGTLKITPTLDVVLGGRWTRDEKSASVNQTVNALVGTLLAGNENRDLKTVNNKFTYRANVNWRPSDDVLFFGSYSTGYKSGGFDSSTLGSIINRVVKPETTASTELGVKSELFDRFLQANITLYRMTVQNYQDRSYNGVSFSVSNAGSIRNQGVEVDTQWRFSEAFRINASVNYLDAKFTSYPNASNLPGLPGTRNITGERPTFTPKWTGTIGGEYRAELGGDHKLGLRGDLAFVSSNNIGQVNNADPQTIQKAYQLVSARATFYGPEDRWNMSLFADNLTDTNYCTSLTYQAFGSFLGVAGGGKSALRCNSVGRPRSFGVSGSISF